MSLQPPKGRQTIACLIPMPEAEEFESIDEQFTELQLDQAFMEVTQGIRLDIISGPEYIATYKQSFYEDDNGEIVECWPEMGITAPKGKEMFTTRMARYEWEVDVL